MTQAGNEENLRELVTPISEWLNGIIAVVHHPCENDPGAKYLERAKGEGKIIYRDFVFRHDFSMNECLFSGAIEEDDLVLICDTMERCQPAFVSRIQSQIGPMMKETDTTVLSYYDKPYLIRYQESMRYQGSPHWSLVGWSGRALEWSQIEPDETKVRWNVRPFKRKDKWQWIEHYCKYMVAYPAGSNHARLGLDKWPGDIAKNFHERENRRLEFRRQMKKNGYPLTVDGLKQLFSKNPLDSWAKDAINSEKTWNDGYRLWILHDDTMVDTHRLEDMRRIE